MTRLNSDNDKQIFWSPKGAMCENETLDEGWYFWDEVGLLGGGPYSTEKECIEKLQQYGDQLYDSIGYH